MSATPPQANYIISTHHSQYADEQIQIPATAAYALARLTAGLSCHNLPALAQPWRAVAEAVAAAASENERSVILQRELERRYLDATATLTAIVAVDPNADAPPPDDGVWIPPIPFHNYRLPGFPTDALADWQREWVEAEAEATQTPPDLAAMLCLSIASAALAGKVKVQVRPGYAEPVNCYIVTILDSGNRKSQVFRDAAAPIEAFEEAETRRLAPVIAEAETEYRIAEAVAQRLQAQAAKAEPSGRQGLIAEAKDAARKLASLRLPESPRLIVDDCSPERLAGLLASQGGRLAVLSSEGEIFELIAGRYSNNGAANLNTLLKAHAGDTLRVDRIARPPEFVQDPALTIGLTIQMDVLRGLAEKPGFRGRGLLARLWYSLPASLLGYRNTNPPPVPEPTRMAYHANITKLLQLPLATNEFGKPAAFLLQLSSEALNVHDEFAAWIEPQLDDYGELGGIKDWAAKLPGAVVRIAGLLHMADHIAQTVSHPATFPISAQCMERAVSIGKYLIPHALAAFGEMGADPEIAAAQYVLRWIERQPNACFSRRDAFEGTKARFRKVEAIEPALRLLAGHQFIRERPPAGPRSRGRPASTVYDVNPFLAAHNSHKSQFPPEGGLLA